MVKTEKRKFVGKYIETVRTFVGNFLTDIMRYSISR